MPFTDDGNLEVLLARFRIRDRTGIGQVIDAVGTIRDLFLNSQKGIGQTSHLVRFEETVRRKRQLLQGAALEVWAVQCGHEDFLRVPTQVLHRRQCILDIQVGVGIMKAVGEDHQTAVGNLIRADDVFPPV